jgi:glycosyltransferase involved in cell wall biosynthesis
MKKLLIATDNFLPRWDGIARFLAEMIPRLSKEYEISVISPDYGLSPIDMEITRTLVPIRGSKIGDYTPAKWKPSMVKKAVKEADIVFAQTIGPIGFLAHRYAKRYKKPLVAFIHSIEWELAPKALSTPFLKRLVHTAAKFLVRFLYKRCTLLIVPSANTAEMLTWMGIDTPKEVVHLGVDTNKFVRGDKLAAKKTLRIPRETFVIGFHGRIGHEKNLITLSRAFLRLKAAKKQLLIVGEGVEELEKRLKRVKDVNLPGSTDNILPYLQAMDLYVMPSYTETTSLACLEAMSCELPVVASPVGFIQQYIKEGENGYFFDTKSSFNLSLKLQRLHDDNRLRSKLSKNARKTVVEQFNWDKTANGIARALRNAKH